MKIPSLPILATALIFSIPVLHAGDFFIHDGDRVVFLGDSITEQRLYTTYIEAFALSRYPTWKLSFRNVGWGGDTAWLRQRFKTDEKKLFSAADAGQTEMVTQSVDSGLERDVLPLKPTVVTVDFGMNDHYYEAFRPDIFRAYVRAETEIGRVLGSRGVRVAFFTPQPIEDKRVDPDQDVRNQALRKFSDGLRDVAAKDNATFVDQFDPYLRVMMASRSATIGGGDAIHPGPIGHTIMAWALLKGLGAGSLVSSVAIDGRTGQVEWARACKIENVKRDNGTIAFDRLDESLPLPIDPKAVAALNLVPLLADLDVYELKVAGLPEGNYLVQIDGVTAATPSARELADGYNLAQAAGPVYQQTQTLLALIYEKNDVYFQRWRDVQLYEIPTWAAPAIESERNRQRELAKLDQKILDLETAIDAARKPKTRHFVITAMLPTVTGAQP